MNTTQENKVNEIIEEKINKGYEIDLGNIIDNSLEVYKKIVWKAGLGYLFVFLLLTILAVFSIKQFLTLEQLNEFIELLKDPQFLKKNPEIMFYYTLIAYSFGILFTPFNAGFLYLCHLANSSKTFSISDLFTFYTNKKGINLIIGTLLISIIILVINIGLKMINLELVSFVITSSISLFTSLFIPLIIFAEHNFSQAISKSIKLVIKSPFTILGVIIIGILFVIIVGILSLCIGLLFTIPFYYCIIYTLYESIIGFEEEKNRVN